MDTASNNALAGNGTPLPPSLTTPLPQVSARSSSSRPDELEHSSATKKTWNSSWQQSQVANLNPTKQCDFGWIYVRFCPPQLAAPPTYQISHRGTNHMWKSDQHEDVDTRVFRHNWQLRRIAQQSTQHLKRMETRYAKETQIPLS